MSDGISSRSWKLKMAAAVTELFIILRLSSLPRTGMHCIPHLKKFQWHAWHIIILIIVFFLPGGRCTHKTVPNYVRPGPNSTSAIIWSSMTMKLWFICSFGCDKSLSGGWGMHRLRCCERLRASIIIWPRVKALAHPYAGAPMVTVSQWRGFGCVLLHRCSLLVSAAPADCYNSAERTCLCECEPLWGRDSDSGARETISVPLRCSPTLTLKLKLSAARANVVSCLPEADLWGLLWHCVVGVQLLQSHCHQSDQGLTRITFKVAKSNQLTCWKAVIKSTS